MRFRNHKLLLIIIFGLFLFTSCSNNSRQVEPSITASSISTTPFLPKATGTPVHTATQPIPSPTTVIASPTPTSVTPTATQLINPLTGLPVENPDLLDRRPVLVKIENLPRSSRPQWGLSLADLVYEYHTEEGTTRFAALYYGNNAEQVGPIRSGRLFDIELVHMYRSQFVFGSAYRTVLAKIYRQSFSDRLILEVPSTSPALYRQDPSGSNYLMLDMDKLSNVLTKNNIDDTPQNLTGMTFQEDAPEGGTPLNQVFVRYSGAIYNRWDYDTESGKYFRYVDKANAFTIPEETYTQLTDRLTDEPITADNVVMIVVKNILVEPNIYKIQLFDTGQAYIARDGKMYEVIWRRSDKEEVLTLEDAQGNPFPFKPGQTWFEILSSPITLTQEPDAWRFVFQFPK